MRQQTPGGNVAKEALMEDDRFRTLFENSADAQFLSEGDTLVDCNSAALRMMGCSQKAEIIGHHPDEFSPLTQPDGQASLGKAREMLTIALAKGSHRFEWVYRRADGTDFPADISLTALTVDGKLLVHGAVRDVTDRDHSQRALRASEARFKQLFDSMADGISLRDARTFELLDANRRFCEMYGYTLEELKALPRGGLAAKESVDERRRRVDAHFGQVVKGASARFQLEARRKDGSTLWVEMNVERLAIGGVDCLLTISRDITERRKAEEALKDSEARFEQFFDSVNDGISVRDARTFELVDANRRFCEMYGYTLEELKALPLGSLNANVSADERRKHLVAHFKQVTKDANRLFQSEGRGKDGSTLWVETNVRSITIGSRDCLLSVVRDITERKKSEQALRESEERYRTAIENSNDGVVITREGRHVYVNQRFVDMFGYDGPEEVLGTFVADARHVYPGDRPWLAEMNTRRWKGERAPSSYVHRAIGKDGRVLNVEASATRIVYQGEPASLSYLRDITERKQAERNQYLSAEILGILNEPLGLPDVINRILVAIKRKTGFDAVGIRLRDGDDFPYYVTDGFSEEFVCAERYLCTRDTEGKIVRDGQGNPVLECRCGNILCGRTDAGLPFFTPGGSFWTNSATHLLASTTEKDRQAGTRNRCNGEGYESVALIPIRANRDIVGLLQLNDRKKDCFTLEMIHFFEGISASIGVALMRKQQEDALRASEEKYRSVYDHAPLGFVLWDKGCRIFEWNEQAEAMFGWSLDEAVGANFFDLIIRGQDRPHVEDIVKDLMSGRIERHIVHQNARKNGEPVWCEWNNAILRDNEGEIVGVVSLALDITDRKRAEEALKLSEEKYRSLVESSSDAIFMVDTQRTITSCNQAFLDLFGYEKGEVENRSVRLIHASDASFEAYGQKAYPAIQKQGTFRAEWDFARKDGTTVPVESVTFAVKGLDGVIKGFAEIIRDITDRKKTEEKIRASLKEKEVLLKEIHHRVKNNLQIISSLLFLQSSRTKHPGAVSALRESRNRVKSMALVHERLYQSPNLASVDMGEYTRNLVSDLQHSHGSEDSTIRLTLNVDDIPLGITEAIPCGLIINELVSNALKHAFPKGRGFHGLACENLSSEHGEREGEARGALPPEGATRVPVVAGEITIRLQRGNTNQITLTVSDNGIGFPEHVDFRKSPSLGLTLVNSLVEQLDGAIELDQSGGTAFTVTFG